VSVCVTQGIKIRVETQYLPDQSEPESGKYIFAYDITIANEGSEPAQLLTRHWIIKDAQNNVEEVRGEGVVGETPYLEPGQSFSYRSYCPLKTEYGTMRGTYGMVRPGGEQFQAVIAPFALMPPYMLN
jgi:ApaG protein